jgi:anti-sigma factor RsiW
MKHDEQLELQALLDGELDAATAARVEARLARDAEASALLGELRMMKTALAQNEPEAKVPESRDFYWSKIAREIEAAEKSKTAAQPVAFSWATLLRRLAPVAGIAALVAIVMLNRPPGPNPATLAGGAKSQFGTIHMEGDGVSVVWVN